jgi:hypothetical protein
MNKKERFYISDIIDDPVVTYPSYYLLSRSMHDNEMLHVALTAIHQMEFDFYHIPKDADEIFRLLQAGQFPIFKEHYAVGYFGGRVMYLESNGWKSMPMTKDAFRMENWLIY